VSWPTLPCSANVTFPPFRLRPTWVWVSPCVGSLVACHAAVRVLIPLFFPRWGLAGSPKFLTLLYTHATLYSGPRQTLADLTNPVRLCWLPGLRPCGHLLHRDDEAVSSFGDYGLSCGLRVSLCTLQLTCSAFASSVAVATLDRSGWLSLTPQGLSPCKKRQASLGAPKSPPSRRVAASARPGGQSLFNCAERTIRSFCPVLYSFFNRP
jgi:hypothetical protein